MIAFEVNGQPVQFSGAADTPLLWVLRDTLVSEAPSMAAVSACAGSARLSWMASRKWPACGRPLL